MSRYYDDDERDLDLMDDSLWPQPPDDHDYAGDNPPEQDDEPSEADLIRYYHSGGGEDPVSRQQIRDAGRPGL